MTRHFLFIFYLILLFICKLVSTIIGWFFPTDNKEKYFSSKSNHLFILLVILLIRQGEYVHPAHFYYEKYLMTKCRRKMSHNNKDRRCISSLELSKTH